MSSNHTCCARQRVKRGLWSPEEDEKLVNYVTTHGHGCWSTVPKLAGLQRCGKSCRLRWINYLRPDLKRGNFTSQEASLIIELHRVIGNRWAQIARRLPGRTDNEVKNFWNANIKRKLLALTPNSDPAALSGFSQNPNFTPTFNPNPQFYNQPTYNQNYDSALLPPSTSTSTSDLPPLPDSFTVNYPYPNPNPIPNHNYNSIADQSYQINDYQPFDQPVQDDNLVFDDQDLDFLDSLIPEMRGIANAMGSDFAQGQGSGSFDAAPEQLHPTHIKNITSLMASFAPPGSFPAEPWDEPYPASSSFTGSSTWGPHP